MSVNQNDSDSTKSAWTLAIANSYGDVDLTRTSLSKQYSHVRGKRLQPICRKLKIKFARAVVGFQGEKQFGYKPLFDGVVVSSRSAQKLSDAIHVRDSKREQRNQKILAELSVLAALFTLNRRAKRCRDLAQTYYRSKMHGLSQEMKIEKESIYQLKEQVLHYLVQEKKLRHEGYHRFPDGNWAEILTGEGYSFHRPCPKRKEEPICRTEIEAKPKAAIEPPLEAAYKVIRKYLDGKPRVKVFAWPPKSRID